MAQQASAVEISRSRGGSTLLDSVSVRLGVETGAVSWDAYRDDDGRWIVTAAVDGRNVGTWSFEPVGRTVQPLDESARALMGGGPSVVAEPLPAPARSESTDDTTDLESGSTAATDQQEATPTRPRLVSITSDPTAPEIPSQGAPNPGQEALIAPADVSSPRRAKRNKGKKGRASVPSWDEILFGASKPED